MNKNAPSRKPHAPNSDTGVRRICVICVICGCSLFLSCLRLDSFLFDPIRLEGDYFDPADIDTSWHVRGNVIPDSLVEPETLIGLSGNKVYGFFVRQPGGTDVCGRIRKSTDYTDCTDEIRGLSAESAKSVESVDIAPAPHRIQSVESVDMAPDPHRILSVDTAPDPHRIQSAESVDSASGNHFTVIYNHGRGENINRYWGRVELLWEAGFNVFIYDYEGYGKSEGTPSGAACYADAEAALSYVRARGIADSTIVLYAWSLGSFMACHLAADIDGFKPRCIILENPMASMSTLARENTVLGIPGSFLVDADFDNEVRMPKLGCRTLIIYGKEDDTAVPERNALVLWDKADHSTTELRAVDGAKHSDVPETMGYDEYKQVVEDFVAGD